MAAEVSQTNLSKLQPVGMFFVLGCITACSCSCRTQQSHWVQPAPTSTDAAPAVVSLVVWLGHHTRFDVPDVLGILVDGAVRAELASTCSHHDAHAGPLGFVLVGRIDLVLQAGKGGGKGG